MRTFDFTLCGVDGELAGLLAAPDQKPESIAPEVLRIVSENLRWDAASFWIADPARRRLRLAASRYHPGVDISALVDSGWEESVSTDEGEIGSAWREDRSTWIADTKGQPGGRRAQLARAGALRTGVWLPMAAGGEVHGVLELFSRRARRLDREQLEGLEALAAQLGQFLGRVRAGAALAAANKSMRLVLESIGDGVVSVDLSGHITLANPRALEILGADELVGRPVADELRFVEEKSGRPIAAPPPVVSDKLRRVRYQNAILLGRSGQSTFVDVTWSPMFGAEGELCGLVAALRDVTERRLEEKRLGLRAQAAELLDGARDREGIVQRVVELGAGELSDWCAIFLVDSDPLRPAAIAYAGEEPLADVEASYRFPIEVSAEAGVGRVIRTAESDLEPEVTDERLSEIARSPEHLELLRGLGIVSWVTAPLCAHDRVLGALTMVSRDPERRFGELDLELAQELADRAALSLDSARQREEAARAVKARDELVSIVSHELKSPLATLDFSLQAMERFCGDEHARRTSEISRRHVGRMKRLIDNMFAAGRIASGRIELAPEACDLAEVVRDTAATLRSIAEQAGSDVRVSADPIPGMWDPLRIEQIVSNLLGNAIKFGGGEPIDLTVERRDGVAQITVRDRGIGIEETSLERIFQRFERFAASSDARTGAGLGLWIVARSVKAMSGEVSVKSSPGRGAEFRVELPIQKPR